MLYTVVMTTIFKVNTLNKTYNLFDAKNGGQNGSPRGDIFTMTD